MAHDPARTAPKSYEERRKDAQEACKLIPCDSVNSYPKCVFCPWEKKLGKAV